MLTPVDDEGGEEERNTRPYPNPGPDEPEKHDVDDTPGETVAGPLGTEHCVSEYNCLLATMSAVADACVYVVILEDVATPLVFSCIQTPDLYESCAVSDAQFASENNC